MNYETAVIRPLRSLSMWIQLEILTAKIERAESEDERKRLIEERHKLNTDFCKTYETRGEKK